MRKLFVFIILTNILFSCNQSANDADIVNKKINSLSPEKEGYYVIADTVKFLIPLDKDSTSDKPPFFMGFNKKRFVRQLVDSVLTGKVKVYDYYDYSEISLDEVKMQLGLLPDTLYEEDSETGEISTQIIQGKFYPDDVRELYVFERWLYNPEKCSFKTEILGFAPVEFTVKDDQPDGEITKKILFTIFYQTK